MPNPSIAANAVGSQNVADASLRAADMSVHTIPASSLQQLSLFLTLTIPAQTCINNNLAVPAIQPGDRVLMFLRNNEPDAQVQNQVVLSPEFATVAGTLPFRACNIGATALTDENIPVNLITIR